MESSLVFLIAQIIKTPKLLANYKAIIPYLQYNEIEAFNYLIEQRTSKNVNNSDNVSQSLSNNREHSP